MIEIQPTALYTRQDLTDLLRPIGIDPDAFIARIQPAKRFRMAWWGADLIQAIERAPLLGEIPNPVPPRRQKHGRCDLQSIDRVLEPLRRLEKRVGSGA